MSFQVYELNTVNITKGFLYKLFLSEGASLSWGWGGEGQTRLQLIVIKTEAVHLKASTGNKPNLFQAIRPYFTKETAHFIYFRDTSFSSDLVTKPFHLDFAHLAPPTPILNQGHLPMATCPAVYVTLKTLSTTLRCQYLQLHKIVKFTENLLCARHCTNHFYMNYFT